MVKIREVVQHLESIAPQALQESYDNAGLITGDPDAEVQSILITLDCTEAVLDEAIENGCNMIVAHHPIVFSGLKKLTGRNYVERTIIKSIKNDVAIFATHTNLDNIHTGVNRMICDKLGIKNPRILSPKRNLLKKLYTFVPTAHAAEVRQAIFAAGAGHIGNYDECSFNVSGEGTFRGLEGTDPFVGERGKQHQEPEVKIEVIFPGYAESNVIRALKEAHPYEEVAYDIITLDNVHHQVGAGMIGELENEMDEMKFLQLVKSTMSAGCVRHTPLRGKNVKKVAVCGGSGSFLLNDAIKNDADVFITADFKYHQFFDAEGKIVIADIGHYESEQFTKDLLYEILRKKFSNFALLFSKTNTNPIKYI